VIRFVLREPIAHEHRVDALLGTGADHRHVKHIDKLGRGAVDDVDDGERAVDAGVNAKHL
jgi:hypothetical protein